jgi:Domain of unknown function (DUF4124)
VNNRVWADDAMKNKLIYCNILLFLLFSTLGQAAQVYRWVDGNGKVHFSDQPGGMNSQTVDVKPIPRHQKMDEQVPVKQTPAITDGGKTTVAQSQPPSENKKARSKNCEIANDNLQRNQDISRMYRLDENGERAFLSEAEREAVLDKSRQQIQKWCG